MEEKQMREILEFLEKDKRFLRALAQLISQDDRAMNSICYSKYFKEAVKFHVETIKVEEKMFKLQKEINKESRELRDHPDFEEAKQNFLDMGYPMNEAELYAEAAVITSNVGEIGTPNKLEKDD